jgi:choline dehydrogenase-like flavoprotein
MHRQLWAGAQYAVFRNGPVSATIVEGGAFWWTDKSVPHPDLQFHFEAITNGTSTGNGCTLSTYLLRPRARGFVTLRSGDPRISPNIDPNFLGDPYDVDQSIKAVQIGQEIMRQPAIAKYLVGEFVTGLDVGTHDGNEAYVRTSGRSGYHPVGTCKMGQDRMAVVDPQLKVHGIDGLRVADSSIMPSLISGNTNAPCIMIGEKASDLLRSNHVVPPVMPSK